MLENRKVLLETRSSSTFVVSLVNKPFKCTLSPSNIVSWYQTETRKHKKTKFMTFKTSHTMNKKRPFLDIFFCLHPRLLLLFGLNNIYSDWSDCRISLSIRIMWLRLFESKTNDKKNPSRERDTETQRKKKKKKESRNRAEHSLSGARGNFSHVNMSPD